MDLETVMIPPRIVNRDHVLTALSRIDREGVPRINQSRGVELYQDGKGYPPKYVISLAFQIATGRALPFSEFITTEAERLLTGLRFSVKRASQPPPRENPPPRAPEKEPPDPPQVGSRLRADLDILVLAPQVRKLADDTIDFVVKSPDAAVRSARAALIAVLKDMGGRGTLDQDIRDFENSKKISEITAIQMRTIQKIRNKVEYDSAQVTSDDAGTCAAALLAILKAVNRSKSKDHT
jgi:hypothetical protein